MTGGTGVDRIMKKGRESGASARVRVLLFNIRMDREESHLLFDIRIDREMQTYIRKSVA